MQPGGPISRFVVAFSDDTAIIEISNSIYMNCKNLAQDFEICDNWAKQNDMVFAPHKFDCMHFFQIQTRYESSSMEDVPQNTWICSR